MHVETVANESRKSGVAWSLTSRYFADLDVSHSPLHVVLPRRLRYSVRKWHVNPGNVEIHY
jgi:hypothetical protein